MVPDWLPRAVERCERMPGTLAQVLAAHRARHGLSAEELSAFLGCTGEALLWLSLCGLPSATAHAVNPLCERFQVSRDRLLAILLEASRLNALG